MRKYILQSEPDYGWFTGRTHDQLHVLMGIDWNAMVCLVFDEDGKYLKCEERYFGYDGELREDPITEMPFHPKGSEKIQSRFDNWRTATIIEEVPIEVEPFHHPSRFIGVEDLPGWAQNYLETKSTRSEADRHDMEKEIHRWRQDGDFVFWWNEDYYCNRDGSVHSS